MSRSPNPQGKGLVPLLEQLAASRACVAVPAKHIEQISRELFTSLFVLESEFAFRPVVGASYSLYRLGEQFRLSLVAPREWGASSPLGAYVGRAELHADLTWSLVLSAEASRDEALLRLIEQRREQLQQRLEAAETVAQVLPVYEAGLRFYPRLFASALAHSLRQSMQGSGIERLSYRQAQGLLSADGDGA